ncbi:MAG TPA: anticodon nuclease [Sulfurovum sp.]|nr:anticodon nuclease [Sulfurovum sp.]
MGNTLKEIAEKLQASPKKVQLIYAFNGVGKTRLSREFKELIEPTTEGEEETDTKIFYYNAFTEDLFYWDNDLAFDAERKLKIQANGFTTWVIQDQGQDQNIITNFQHYTSDKLTPRFNADSTEVSFSLERGDNTNLDNLKISKGEESNFIWSIFYSLIEQVVDVLNVPEVSDRETDKFNQLQYVFIDDPVTSLDENHLIELAVNLAQLIKSSTSDVKFIITTHNALFYNVLFNELSTKACYMLEKNEDGSFELTEKRGDSNKSFSYHLYLKQTIEQAIEANAIEKYHFMLLRNLYEKTANFLGYPEWKKLLPDDNREAYYHRIIQFTSHSTLSNETVSQPTNPEKQTVRLLLEHLNTKFWKEIETDAYSN